MKILQINYGEGEEKQYLGNIYHPQHFLAVVHNAFVPSPSLQNADVNLHLLESYAMSTDSTN